MKEFLLSMQKSIRKIKKAALITVATVLLFTNVWAQGGTTGPLTWDLADGVLTISGEGEMPNYEWIDSPWISHYQSIKAAVIKEGVTSIGESGFQGCLNMLSISIPNSVTAIRNWAFGECGSLTSINIPHGVASIGSGAFCSCYSLTSVSIPNSVTVIEEGTFGSCVGLTSITIPESVIAIKDAAFRLCTGLTSVIISSSVTSIEEWAFDFCYGLVEIINLNSVPQVIVPNVFYSVDLSTCVLSVRNSALEAYKTADVWKDFNIVGGDYMVYAFPNNVAHGHVDGGGLYAAGATVSLTATANPGYQFESWTSGGIVPSTENPYTFTVTSDISITANFKSNGTSVDDMENQLHEILVYPNPATDKIHISSQESVIKQITLFNQLGQQITTATASEINLSGLPKGVYILRVETDRGMVTKKGYQPVKQRYAKEYH